MLWNCQKIKIHNNNAQKFRENCFYFCKRDIELKWSRCYYGVLSENQAGKKFRQNTHNLFAKIRKENNSTAKINIF